MLVSVEYDVRELSGTIIQNTGNQCSKMVPCIIQDFQTTFTRIYKAEDCYSESGGTAGCEYNIYAICNTHSCTILYDHLKFVIISSHIVSLCTSNVQTALKFYLGDCMPNDLISDDSWEKPEPGTKWFLPGEDRDACEPGPNSIMEYDMRQFVSYS